MAEFQFLVTVEVENWPDEPDIYGRTAADYATAALYATSLPDAARLDGFADLSAEASIPLGSVDRLP